MFKQITKLLNEIVISLSARILAGFFIFYLLFSYFAINPLAKRILPWVAENKLASHATVDKVEFDPFRLKTTIENFSLTEKSGAPLAGFDKMVIDLETSGIFDWAWKFKEISITAPRARFAISSKGKFNWADLIAKLNEDKSPPSNTIPRVEISHIAVVHGELNYVDANRPAPFTSGLTPLDFELDGFSTLPKDRGDYLLAAKLPDQGGTLKWKGNMGVNPVASTGSIAINSINIAKLMQVLKGASLPFKATNGNIQGDFSYDFHLVKDQPKVALSNIVLSLNKLTGNLNQVGDLAIKQAKIAVPQLDFSTQNKPELRLQKIVISLDELSVQLAQDSLLELKQVSTTLPDLNIALQNDTQVQFQDMSFKLQGLNLAKANVPLLNLPSLDVNQVGFNLAERSVKIAQVTLPNGTVNASIDKSGVLNWQQAFAIPSTQSKSSPVNTTAKTDSQETQKPFTLDVADIQLQHWHGTFQNQALIHPLQISLADFNLSFAFATPEGNMEVSKLDSNLAGLAVKSALFKDPVATLAKLNLNQGEVSFANQRAVAQSIELSGLKSEIIKQTNRPLNWQEILATIPSAVNKSDSATNQQNNQSAWDVSLKKLALDNGSLHVEDRSLATPVVMDINNILFEVQDPSLNLTRSLPVKASFQIKQGGQFNTSGKLTLSPFKTNLNIKLADLRLKPFSAYINQFALLEVNDGYADMSGNLSLKKDKDLALAFKGGFSVNKFALIEEENNAPFLAWDRVNSDNLEISMAPNLVHMTQLQIVKPTGKFIIHEDRSMNVTRILRNQPVSTTSAPTNTPKATEASTKEEALTDNNIPASNSALDANAPQAAAISSPSAVEKNTAPDTFPISIETVSIDSAELDFADLSLKPQFGTHINSLSGVINGISTDLASVAQVEMDGKVDDYGSAKIRGSIQPFKPTNFTDLKLSFKNLDMNRLTPYSGKFAGRRIDSGKLSADLEYKIKQRQLAGENKFIINKLKLGEKVDSKEAADLPLDLAIAILEDSDGVIDLDLPISGSLDDPKFSYGSIVWKAIKNVLSKIVTAPFHALGKLFGGSGDKLEGVAFEAGSSAILPPEQEKLNSVSQALNKRPKIALSIAPGYDPTLDTRAIQELTLRKQVAEEMGVKLSAGQQPGPIDLTNPKTQKVLDDLYDTLTKKGLLKRLASKLEKPKAGHFEEIQEKLTASIVVTEPDLQALALTRGEMIKNSLIANAISADRIAIKPSNNTKSDGATISTKLTIELKDNKATDVAP